MNSKVCDPPEASCSFNLTSKEGQQHLKTLNEELKALNEQGSSKLSLLHGPEDVQTQKRVARKRKLKNVALKEDKKVSNSQSSDLLLRKKIKKKSIVSSEPNDTNESKGEISDSEIDHLLDEKAWKSNLSAVNVKNILKYVVTNEQVLAMIDQKMKLQEGVSIDGEENTSFQLKLTRSKTKKLLEDEVQLPWPISPIKTPAPTKKLIELKFSDSETSSDEEYQPEIPIEEVGINDESVNSSQLSESDNGLEGAVKDVSDSELSESTIALRTRSKLPLNDTPLEIIEASFIAPDITVDMYASECDDEEWQGFLKDFSMPLDKAVEVNDDDVNDPEYHFIEEEDIPDVEDLRCDRAVRIPRKELHELMEELLESEYDYSEVEDHSVPEISRTITRPDLVFEENLSKIGVLEPQSEVLFDLERKKILDEQMRMHVQLLLQVFVLASDNLTTSTLKNSTKTLLIELDSFAMKNELLYSAPSSFSAHNLKSSLNIVLQNNIKPSDKGLSKGKISDGVLSTIVHSDAFIYPELLPITGFKPSRSNVFSAAEDKLLALGLEQFSPLKEFSCWELIRTHMIPIYTTKQISIRAKNLRTSTTKFVGNPVKYYYENKLAPVIKHNTQPFDSATLCPLFKRNVSIPAVFQNFMSESRRTFSEADSIQSKTLRQLLPNPYCVFPTEKINSNNDKKVSYFVPLQKICGVEYQKKLETIIDKETMQGKSPLKKNVLNSNLLVPLMPTSPSLRTTPLRQVSPILKKYNRTIFRRTGGNIKNNRKRLPKLLPKEAPIKKSEIESKVLTSNDTSVAESKSKLEEKVTDQQHGSTPNSDNNIVQLKADQQKQSDTDSKASKDAIQIMKKSSFSSEDQLCDNVKIKEKEDCEQELAKVVINSEILPTKEMSSEKTVITEFRDSGSEVEGDLFDDGDDTADDDLVEIHADNEDDLAALMAASTTIKTNPKQKHNIIKRKKQKCDQKSLLSLLSCETLEMDLNPEKDNAYAEAFLSKVREVVGMNDTYEQFLKTLHDFKSEGQSVAQLYKDVSKILKDYPELCDEFVIFLFPEQASECGKLMEYININKMHVFLKKLEVHFGKHPQQIHKLIRAISQIHHSDNPTMEELIKTVMPLLRGQQHLMEEFMQLFPQESVPKNRMIDFEEVYVPNGDEELPVDEQGFETVINFPEQNDPYGGPDCICTCHASDKSKNQTRLRHCVGCGIKFIEGRVFLQTGKVMKPCKVIYLNNEENVNQDKIDCKVSKPTVKCLPHFITSPISSASSLSPLVNSDEEKVYLESATKVLQASSQADPTIEDAVLIADTSTKKLPNFMPPDSSAFHQVCVHNEKDRNDFSTHGKQKQSKRSTTTKSKPSHNVNENIGENDKDISIDSETPNPQSSLEIQKKWTRENDKFLLETCQRLKANDETFSIIALQLENKTSQDVENRFKYLMSIFEKSRQSIESPKVNEN